MMPLLVKGIARRTALLSVAPFPRLSAPMCRMVMPMCRIALGPQRSQRSCIQTAAVEVDKEGVTLEQEVVAAVEEAGAGVVANKQDEGSAKLSPGEADMTRFSADSSVMSWRGYALKFGSQLSMNEAAREGGSTSNVTTTDQRMDLNDLLQKLRNNIVVKDVQSVAYWSYHFARLSFFIGQAGAGLVAHDLTERARGDLPTGVQTSLQRMSGKPSELYARTSEAVGSWRQDYDNIDRGLYKLPWDMTTLTHRQYNPLFAISRTVSFVNEAVQTLVRRHRGTPEELWMQSDMYPPYFTKSYHYQTDGWLSDKSAAVYEHSTETLFFGRQDAMQRSALVPISMWIEDKCGSSGTMRLEDVQLLEIGAGTGRFHTFVKDNWPEMKTICSDLSPFYLAKARENLKYWKSLRQPDTSFGGPDKTGTQIMQASAESLTALADESQHVVVHMYLFHELPEEARRKAVAEMYRVLKPGGLAVFTDSVQNGDRPEWDGTLTNFENFNEPYYRSYVACDFGEMYEQAGFRCGGKWVNSSTKTLSFFKPNPDLN